MSLASRNLRICVALFALGLGGAAYAAGGMPDLDGGFEDPRAPIAGTAEVMQSNGMSLSQAVERVRRKYPGGRIIDAKTSRSGNREVHVIKVLTADNKVKTERVNGRRLDNRG
jgi:hypothetical protein